MGKKERAKSISTDFSVTDSEYPEFRTLDDDLIISYKDWREDHIQIRFRETIAFKWQMIDELEYEGEDYYGSYIIENSGWLKKHWKAGSPESDKVYVHYKFNFNSFDGSLEVICEDIEVLSEDPARTDTGPSG